MDFNDENTHSFKPSPKIIAIIAIGLLVAVLILVFVLRFVNRGSNDSLQQLLSERQSSIQQICANSEDQENCLRLETQKAAVQTGSTELCESLDGDVFDECVWEIASENKDAEICESIVDEHNRQVCSDTIFFRVSIATGNSSGCDKIKDEEKKQGCQGVIAGPVTAENCVLRQKEPAECEVLKVIAQAGKKQDRRLCDQLKDDAVFVCQDQVLLDDPDFDGLESSQEISYKSNPDKADSDGDGYTDGDEVAAGYNPNGKGKLQPSE